MPEAAIKPAYRMVDYMNPIFLVGVALRLDRRNPVVATARI